MWNNCYQPYDIGREKCERSFREERTHNEAEHSYGNPVYEKQHPKNEPVGVNADAKL